MRLIFSAAAAITLAVVLLAACNSNDFKSKVSADPNNLTTQTPSDGVARITVTELKEMVDKGTALIVDTRGADAYATEHIKGSISIPEAEISNRSGELPRDKMIVAYCS
ncbi:MAG TPA: rhodanese-like domain-containing protein [Pyrinomonadaceae bacterium]|jgi:3-mercaptopyruvate sulfurtransferase SseA